MLIFQFKGKEYIGDSALDVVKSMEINARDYASQEHTTRFLLWSLEKLGHRLPARDLFLSDCLADEELALSYLCLLDEYGEGILLKVK